MIIVEGNNKIKEPLPMILSNLKKFKTFNSNWKMVKN